jgi:hypothetical protein
VLLLPAVPPRPLLPRRRRSRVSSPTNCHFPSVVEEQITSHENTRLTCVFLPRSTEKEESDEDMGFGLFD